MVFQYTRTTAGTVTDTVTDTVKRLLLVINDSSLSTKEIMTKLSLKHKNSFLESYLRPAINSKYIALLYPNNPKHPKQKYYLTELGKELIKV